MSSFVRCSILAFALSASVPRFAMAVFAAASWPMYPDEADSSDDDDRPVRSVWRRSSEDLRAVAEVS